MHKKQTLQVISIKKWAILIAVILFFLALSAWIFFGKVEVKVSARGIVTAREPLDTVYCSGGYGYVRNLSVSLGSYVVYGQPIAHIETYGSYYSQNADDITEIQDEETVFKAYASSSGLVVAVDVKENSDITPSTSIIRIAKNFDTIQSRYILVPVPIETATRLSTGMEVRVSDTNAPETKQLTGYISCINGDMFTSTEAGDWIASESAVRNLYGEDTAMVSIMVVLDTNSDGQFYSVDGTPDTAAINYGDYMSVDFIISSLRPVDMFMQ